MTPPLLGALSVAVMIGVAAAGIRPRAHRMFAGDASAKGSRLGRIIDRAVPLVWHRRPVITPADTASWCDDLARRLRAGSTMRDALTLCEPAASALRTATEPLRLALERGRPVVDAVAAAAVGDAPPGWSPRRARATARQSGRGTGAPRGRGHLDLALAVVGASARVGGSGAAAVDRVAAALRLRAADARERSSHAAQARLSALVLTVVPLAMLTLLVVTDSDVRATVATRLGAACIAAGLTLNLGGALWMNKIIAGRA